MISNMNIELKKILLRRRSKVLFDSNKNIFDKYKDEIARRISESELLKDRCTLEYYNDISINIKIDGYLLKFINGELVKDNDDDNEKENSQEALQKLPIPSDDVIDELALIIKTETIQINKNMIYALTLNKNINELGYTMDDKMLKAVSCLSVDEINELSNELISTLKEMVGANFSYNPLYPNFPTQVIEMDEVNLYLNALIHYWSSGIYYPYTKTCNNIQEETNKGYRYLYINISMGKEEDLHEFMVNLMKSKEAISFQDIRDLNTYFTYYKEFLDIIPDMIPNKENIANVTNLIFTHGKEENIPMDKIKKYFTVSTDVLRLASVMSRSSATLCNVRFKSFSNKERRLLMNLLNNCQNRKEDIYRHHNLWSRLMEKIHPMKFKNIYPELIKDLAYPYIFKKEKKCYKKQYKGYNVIVSFYNSYMKNTLDYRITSNTFDKKIKEALKELKKTNPPKELQDFFNTIEQIYNQKRSKSKDSDFSPVFQNLESIKTLIKENKQEIKMKIRETDLKIANCKINQRFLTKLHYLLSNKNYDEALNLLSQRPGEFSRRLDEMLSRINDYNKVIDAFEKIAYKVSDKVLLSLKGYFQKRNEQLKVRVFLIKGTEPKMYLKTKVKNTLDNETCDKICHICDEALMSHFEKKEKMNKVYVSEELKKYVIPLDLRSANPSLETYSKGSRFSISYNQPSKEDLKMMIQDKEEELAKVEKSLHDNKNCLDQLKEKISCKDNETELKNKNEISQIVEEIKKIEDKILTQQEIIEDIKNEIEKNKNMLNNNNKTNNNKIRLFIWWTNTKSSRIDIDLSIMIYDENLSDLGHISYTCLKDDKFKIYHSGDIIDGGDVDGPGVAEFIDFDPNQIIGEGGRYIAVSVISYGGTTFSRMENCKFGWMERNDLESGQLFEPKTVRQRLDLNSNSTSTVPAVFDCLTREIIWIDSILIANGCMVRIENFGNNYRNSISYYNTSSEFIKTTQDSDDSSISDNLDIYIPPNSSETDLISDDNENPWIQVTYKRTRRNKRPYKYTAKRKVYSRKFTPIIKKNPMNGLLYYYLNPLKENIYNLVQLHIKARNGQMVDSLQELSDGDIAFVPTLPYKCIEGVKYIRPTDLDIILSEYMTL